MKKFFELNHTLSDGMAAYPGMPSPSIGAFLNHSQSRSHYENKAEFYIGKFDIVCTVGTYLDSPFHRYPGGDDLSQIPLEKIAGLPGIVFEGIMSKDRSITIDCIKEDLRGRAVLIKTGWDDRWGLDKYWEQGPFLSQELVELLIRAEAALVGVDFWNIDNTQDPIRPAHTQLLASNILVVEHLCNLRDLPRDGFKFYAIPLRIEKGASFPVRAFAEIDA